jgi:hypothetical protein
MALSRLRCRKSFDKAERVADNREPESDFPALKVQNVVMYIP